MLIYLIAGEPSGDMLGARLMRALKEKDPTITFAGIGGENMEKEGLTSLFDISDLAIMGLAEVIPSIPKVLRHIKNTVQDIASKKPAVVITIDSWSFSARVHKALRKKGIKVLQMHYVAPQVWAWKKGRAKTMHKYIDRLLTLFPNEPQYFTPHNLPTDFVGHPVIESSMLTASADEFLTKHNLKKETPLMLLLPGSRHNEVERLLPTFLSAAKILQKKHKDLTFVLPTVKTVEGRVRRILNEQDADNIIVVNTQAERYAAARAARAAIAASGTVALELSVVDVPHIIAYKLAPLTGWIARHFVHIKYVNLTNILLNRLVIPEILQEDCTPEKLAEQISPYLEITSPLRKKMQQDMADLRHALGMGQLRPSQKAATIILNAVADYNKSGK